MTSCPFCGETSFYPAGPHTAGPCPLKEAESEQRMRHAEAEHQVRMSARAGAPRELPSLWSPRPTNAPAAPIPPPRDPGKLTR